MSSDQPAAPEILDEQRLQALYTTGLLDTKPEALFDRFTYFASCLLDTPISLITLLDKNRQFFKSAVGVEDVIGSLQETPLSYSLCQYVVSSAQPMAIEDANQDDILCDNLSVTELGVVAYIGFPIRTMDGHVIGTLCAIDVKSRKWTEAEHEHLKALSELVMTEIDLRMQLAARAQSEENAVQKVTDLEIANRQLKTALLNEKRLVQERRAAIEASNLKSQFLAMVSHEIRTPLNGIIGMASLLELTQLTSEQKEYVDIINGSGDELLTILNNILDLSKIEANKFELEHQPFDLQQTVVDVIEVFSIQSQEKGLELSHRVDPQIPALVYGDVLRFRQVLKNLLSNAIKFTHKGNVDLSVDVLENGLSHIRIRIEVLDTGIGISPTKIDRLFKPFSQIDSSTTRKYGGTGLGLAISKRLIELMNGEIFVTSQPGQGSVFTIEVGLQKYKVNKNGAG